MMKTTLLVFSFAMAAFSNDPITEFPAGSYLGEGRLVSTTGSDSTYASFASLSSDALTLAIVRDGVLFGYDLYFEFGNYGFFSVEATEVRNGEEFTHYGQGYCRSVQCHFSFELEDRIIEETLTFATWESKIYTLGSMRYTDGNGEQQALSWEERFILISEDSAN